MTSHLDDAAFAELWTNALADGTAPAANAHLQVCAECRLRFTSFSNWMDDLRLDALADADDALSPERLAAQQAHIFRRLEAAERPARVIAFPKLPAAAMRPSPVRRWIAAAAAAGLITGIGLGQMLDLRILTSGPSTFPADRVTATNPRPGVPAAVPALALLNEEAALVELEEVATPHYEALRAYDTFTPRAADFIQPR
ncbi:MAG TPA: hypothetical protein VJ813_12530 [Vicinamibacterales bacterium]|nr:hypothetical protein [Vicinamibacterales bacterium]